MAGMLKQVRPGQVEGRTVFSCLFREQETIFRVLPVCSGEHFIQWALLLMSLAALTDRGKGLGE